MKYLFFFGLSGTGKTTLSTDEGRQLIGDDEHGLNDDGIFNFEGGCYAKTLGLTLDTEPGIYKACTRFGSLLENVVLDNESRNVNFMDKSLAENARASYPLNFIPEVWGPAKGPLPNHIFFLSADAFGVLPPVALLNPAQAMYYFLSGYTSKLAGTEIGIKEPKATFSACFGAPFMPRLPSVYGKLLGHYMDKYKIPVWLVNTGWTGGPYGEGKRFPLLVTRNIIRAIQKGDLSKEDQNNFTTDPIFGFQVPKVVSGVKSDILNPKSTWEHPERFDSQAQDLAKMFHQNFAKFPDQENSILAGAPLFK